MKAVHHSQSLKRSSLNTSRHRSPRKTRSSSSPAHSSAHSSFHTASSHNSPSMYRFASSRAPRRSITSKFSFFRSRFAPLQPTAAASASTLTPRITKAASKNDSSSDMIVKAIPTISFRFEPMSDFPLTNKFFIYDFTNTDPDSATCYKNDAQYPDSLQQTNTPPAAAVTMHGSDGAVNLYFDVPAWHGPDLDYNINDHLKKDAGPEFSWSQLSTRGSINAPIDRPLRLSMASTGMSKDRIAATPTQTGGMYFAWKTTHLPNFAVPGQDTAYLTGDDALVVGHVDINSDDTRFQYVPLYNQHSDVIRRFLDCYKVESHIELFRLLFIKRGITDIQSHLQHLPPININELTILQGDSCFVSIGDVDTARLDFRKLYVQQYPDVAQYLLSDDEKRSMRSILTRGVPNDMFLNRFLPLPSVTPVHSLTEHDQDTYDNNEIDYSTLTSREVFSNMGKSIPRMHTALLGVADGVGGLSTYGDRNQTKQLSHQLCRTLRHHLTREFQNGRDLLSRAWASIFASRNINLGATTVSFGTITVTEPEEPEDEWDDGRRLKLSLTNGGDSTVVAFRPRHNSMRGASFFPLAVTWPMHHPAAPNSAPAPFQLGVPDSAPLELSVGVPFPTLPMLGDQGDILTTSHFKTPTVGPVSGPSGGHQPYISASDMRKIDLTQSLADYAVGEEMDMKQRMIFDYRYTCLSDRPWSAQSVENVKLRRGDIVVACSDGIMDNLDGRFIPSVAEAWQAVVGTLHPGLRAQHSATRNVAPFRQSVNKGNLHQHSTSGVLGLTNSVTPEQLVKLTEKYIPLLDLKNDPRIEPYDATKPYLLSSASYLPPVPSVRPVNYTAGHDREVMHYYKQLTERCPRYHSTLTDQEEGIIAGSLSSSLAGGLVALSRTGSKMDDMSVVVAVVY